jgi:deuterolysin
MLFLSIITFGFATAALASPMKRLEGLTIELKAASAKVGSVNDISLTAVVKNSGIEDARVLKYNTVLDSLPTRSFIVTKDGTPVAFSGINVSLIFVSYHVIQIDARKLGSNGLGERRRERLRDHPRWQRSFRHPQGYVIQFSYT